MSLEPPELVALRHGLGRQLAALRQAAEFSQRQVARRTGYSRSSVAHAEAGRQLLTRDFWKTADELVKADGALVAGHERVRAAKREHELRSREAELAAARARAAALRATTVPQPPRGTDLPAVPVAPGILSSLAAAADGELHEQLAEFLREWDAMNRRLLLRLLGWTATTVAASPVQGLDTEEQERLVRAVHSPSRVDARVVDHIEAMLRHGKLQEDALGSRAVLPTLLGRRDLVGDLLTECPTDLRARLLSIYSDMSTSIGYYYFELDDVDRARRCHEQARMAAHDAGSTELGIYALCEWSYTESWHGRTATGIDLTTVARSLMSKTEDPLMPVAAAQRAATAHAFDGQYHACMVELEKARDSLASAGQVSHESPAYFYNEGYLTSHRSECLLRLGKPREAAASAGAGLMLYDKSFADGYAVCTLHLGNAHLQAGELDEAARVVGVAADLAAQTRSARLMKELRATRGRMQPWQNTPTVKALDEQLSEHGLRRDS